MNSIAPSRSCDRHRLTTAYTPMARRIAHKMARSLPKTIESEELVACAMLGLVEAAHRFDPSRGEPFVAFAEARIRGAVIDQLRKTDLLPRRARARVRKLAVAEAELTASLGRPPEELELATKLGVSLNELRKSFELSASTTLLDPERLATSLPSPADQVVEHDLWLKVRSALTELPERDVTVMSLYYLEGLTYAEIGTVLGVTESRVCQLHGRAITRLRSLLDGAV